MSPEARPRVIEFHPSFDIWLRSLKDQVARRKIVLHLFKAEAGNLGDHHDVGDGVWEFRIDHGPGYRVYYVERGLKLLVLTGGTKKTQGRDIKKAKDLKG